MATDGANPYEDEPTNGTVDMDAMREKARLSDEHWSKQTPAMENDLQFLVGNQWPNADKQARLKARRQVITINDLGQYLDQIVGDLRQNPTSIEVIPADLAGKNNMFASNSGRTYTAAEVYMGLIRQIEYDSQASVHYNLAAQHAAESGLGYLRVYADYCSTKSMEQDIRVERIKNRFSVMCDPMATQPDWSDQNNAFVGDWMPRKEFEKKYPKAHATPIPSAYRSYWDKPDYVRVTEYYWREQIDIQLAQLNNGTIITDGKELATKPEQEAAAKIWEVMQQSGRIIKQRKATTWQVKWALVTYDDTLEGPYTLPGTLIPVIPVIGKRIEGDEDTYHYGLIRFAKEPKMMENYWLTSATERVAQMPKMPWLVTEDQIEGYENDWAEANLGLKPYLRYNATNGGAAPQRQIPPSVPSGELQMMLSMREVVKGSVGLHDASIGKGTNGQSGRALMALEHSGDVGNFVFSDNLGIAVNYVGRVIMSWIPTYYSAGRFITIHHRNDEVDTIEVNRVVQSPDGTGPTTMNDLTTGSFDTHVEAGPAYSTLREQASASMIDLIKAAPETAPILMDLIVDNMDWPGSDVAAKRLRKLVPMGIRDDSELSDDEKRTPPQPTLDQQIGMANAQGKLAEAKAVTAQAQGRMAQAEGNRAVAIGDIATADAAIQQATLKVHGSNIDLMQQLLEALTQQTAGQATDGDDATAPEQQPQPTQAAAASQQPQPQPQPAAGSPPGAPQQLPAPTVGDPQSGLATPSAAAPSDANNPPVTMSDFENLKNELAQLVVSLVSQSKGLGPSGPQQ